MGFKGLGVRGANFGRASNFRQSNPESFRVGSPIPDEEHLQWTQESIYSNKLYALRALRMWGLAYFFWIGSKTEGVRFRATGGKPLSAETLDRPTTSPGPSPKA